MSKPTPRPWKWAHDGYQAILSGNKNFVELIQLQPTELSEANAAHIVKCVNMRDELVEALRGFVGHCGCSAAERDSGHKVDCFAPYLADLLAKAEAE